MMNPESFSVQPTNFSCQSGARTTFNQVVITSSGEKNGKFQWDLQEIIPSATARIPVKCCGCINANWDRHPHRVINIANGSFALHYLTVESFTPTESLRVTVPGSTCSRGNRIRVPDPVWVTSLSTSLAQTIGSCYRRPFCPLSSHSSKLL
ncbi:hypothetical protein E1B28_012749 [Marasmius oreades]|uniref:Uncharacterized protein n=1 Tax=Marasmius oreades TaxID=181124 RepID=A0A9P7RTH6_9AGAR|nr:uncharacterized protein E1B28_012749 [Marasmius oreades]KAG7088783.1 hypothetical protein E1B28_012749 [Marasmius oreades]